MKTVLDETTCSALSPKEVGMIVTLLGFKSIKFKRLDWIWLLFSFSYYISKAVDIFV